jgi:hypothetical protein
MHGHFENISDKYGARCTVTVDDYKKVNDIYRDEYARSIMGDDYAEPYPEVEYIVRPGDGIFERMGNKIELVAEWIAG